MFGLISLVSFSWIGLLCMLVFLYLVRRTCDDKNLQLVRSDVSFVGISKKKKIGVDYAGLPFLPSCVTFDGTFCLDLVLARQLHIVGAISPDAEGRQPCTHERLEAVGNSNFCFWFHQSRSVQSCRGVAPDVVGLQRSILQNHIG
jgi:hypothetical protein